LMGCLRIENNTYFNQNLFVKEQKWDSKI